MRSSLLGFMLLISIPVSVQGQNDQEQLLASINSSGSDASVYNGSVSHSIGQVFFTSITVSSGTLASGVQQAFNDDGPLLHQDDHAQAIKITAYPNPMVDHLIIEVGKRNGHSFSFKLLTMGGKVMEEQKLRQPITKITPNITASVTYILNIYRDDVRLRTFKIIKK